MSLGEDLDYHEHEMPTEEGGGGAPLDGSISPQQPEPEPEPERARDGADSEAWMGLGRRDEPMPSSRSFDSAWEENHTEATTADAGGGGGGGGSEDWDCCPHPGQLPPIEAEDLARAARAGPDRLAPTFAGRPRRVAVCHSVGGHYSGLGGLSGGSQEPLARQDSGAPPTPAVLLVKYYDAHDRLGVYDGHDGAHLGDLRLSLEPGSQFADLCVSNRYQTVFLADQVNSRVYAVDLTGRLLCTVSKRLAGPQAVCFDDRPSLLFVCQRRKVLLFEQQQRQRQQRPKLRFLRSLKSPDFRNLASASAREGRLWLADSQADRVLVFTVSSNAEFEPLRAIALQNPQCVSLDASGCGFVTSGEPVHRVTVYSPDGSEVGSFGGWGARANRMKLPTGICAYQLSSLVDKRMVVLCCFAEHEFRMYSLKNPDTSVI